MSAVALNEDFQQRVFARIRESIGELMSEDELKKLLAASIDKAFFENRKIPRSDSWGNARYEEADSVFIEEARKLLDTQVRTAIQAYMKEHEEALQEGVRRELAAAVPKIIASMVKAMIDSNTFSLINELRNQGVIR